MDILQTIGALALGLVLRTFLPYVIAVFQSLENGEGWLKFEIKYLGSFGLAVVGCFLTYFIKGGFEALMALEFWNVALIAYTGQSVVRELIKLVPERK